jgi:hypothetical protein
LQVRYLNTDLDLSATEDLRPLAAAFESQGFFPLHVEQIEEGSWFAAFETREQYDEPESNIAAMLSIIERLDEPEQKVWQNLKLREFNIGYDCGLEPRVFEQGLSNTTLKRIAEVGASLRVMLYAYCAE